MPTIDRRAVRSVLGVWAVWLVATVGFVALAVAVGAISSGPADHGMPGVTRIGPLWPLRSWDFARYARIATDGYPTGRVVREDAFFPLWPLILAAGRPLVHMSVVGGLVAWASSAAAFVGVALLNPLAPPRRTAVALALMPGSFALALAYPDGLALAAAVWACVFVRRGPTWPALSLALVPALARPNGFLLALPLLLLARRREGRDRRVALAAAAMPVVGTAAVHLYLAVRTGDLLAFTHAQRYWDRGGPWLLVWSLVRVLWTGHLQTVAEALAAAFAIWLARRLWHLGPAQRPWALYALAVLALSLGSGSYQSIPRQSLFAFPLVWAAAAAPSLQRPRVVALAVAANAGLVLALPLMPP